MLPLLLALGVFADICFAGGHAPPTYSTTRHRHVSPGPVLEAPALPRAVFSAPIVSRTARRASKTHALNTLRSAGGAGTHIAPLTGANYCFEYLVDITIGGQTFPVIVDTGSSDTWLVQKGFACYNLTGHPEPATTCAFGSLGFDAGLSKSFQAYPNTKFSITYGDGEYLSGAAAFETVSVGGLTVKHQEIGVVSSAAWAGDGINSGLLGLAYPFLTSVTNTTQGQSIQYNPFFFNAVKQSQVPHPYFSIALNRGTPAATHSSGPDPHLGFLAFGGIAPVPVTTNCVTIPVQGYSLDTRAPTSAPHPTYSYYTADVQAYVFPNSSAVPGGTASNQTILDSGTTLNLVPTEVARAYNTGWGNVVWRAGTYYVDCAAQAPPFAVVFGGKTFAIDPRDQVVWIGKDTSGNDVCVSGTQDGGPVTMGSVFILGDVFLHNVVATFDIQRNQITVTQRQKY